MTKRKVIRHIGMVSMTRKFGGKRYTLAGESRTKKKAQQRANKFRKKMGYNARVVRAPKHWVGAKWFVFRRRKR